MDNYFLKKKKNPTKEKGLNSKGFLCRLEEE